MTTLFKAAKASDLIRRKSWREHIYLYHCENLGFSSMIVKGDRDSAKASAYPFHLTKDDLFATDWEIYERVTKVQSSDDRETDAGHSKLCDRVLEPPSHRRQDY